jgi:hypothetical protein
MAFTPSGVSTAFTYPTQVGGGTGFTGIITAVPPNVNPPIIFEPSNDFTGNQVKVVMIVTGPGTNWGGAQVWASADGTTYGQIGTVYEGGVQGVLTAPFPSHSDPDTVDTLSVDVTMSEGSVIAGSTTDADMGITLAYVGGELVGYSAATLTSPFNYNLGTYIRRGSYGSVIGAHSAGASFGLVNGNIFSQIYPSSWAGRTVYFKFLSYNSVGGALQSLASVVAYPYTLTGNGVSPVGPSTTCPTTIVLFGGAADIEWGSLDSDCVIDCADWGTLSDAVSSFCIDMGVLG